MLWKYRQLQLKNQQLEAELAEAKSEWLRYQRDWNRMLTLVNQLDQALEREQELVKRLSKSLTKKRKK